MASVSSPISKTHVRSISLPSRSHPLTVRVEMGLQQLRTWAASALLHCSPAPAVEELLPVGLQALDEMYDCVEELLHLPRTQAVLSRHQHERWMAVEMDGSVRLLDVCGATRDVVASMKEHAQVLQSALRTRSGDSCHAAAAFVRARKKARKDISKCLKSLKQVAEHKNRAFPPTAVDGDLSLALKALTELREVTAIVLRSISALTTKPSRWLPSSQKKCGEGDQTHVLGNVEASLRCIYGKRPSKESSSSDKVEDAKKRLLRLESSMGSVEVGLESLHKRLLKKRVSLLNIFSL